MMDIRNAGHSVPLLFAGDGKPLLRRNLKAGTLPERIAQTFAPSGLNELFRPQAGIPLGGLRGANEAANLESDGEDSGGSKRSRHVSFEDIRKRNYGLAASRHRFHQAEMGKHEPLKVLINYLPDLEGDIQGGLEKLLAMISVPKIVAGFKGAFTSLYESNPREV